jgi:hypothetical protein
MKRLVILFSLLLSACANNAPIMSIKWPDAPATLRQACPPLEQIDPTTQKLSDALTVITNNYSDYHTCELKVQEWNEWYDNQTKIYGDK